MKHYINLIFKSFILYLLALLTLYLFALATWSNPLYITDLTKEKFLLFGIIFCIFGVLLGLVRRKYTKEDGPTKTLRKPLNIFKLIIFSLVGFIILVIIFLNYVFNQGF